MDFLDYREKLGIGCYDGEKFTFFLTKIFNFLNGISEYTYSGCVTSSEYFSFCNLTGSRCNPQLSADCQNRERFNECLTILDRHRNRLEEFLAYYIAFTNSIEPQKDLPSNWTRAHFANLLLQAYTSFMNNYAKHRDATSNRLLEYLMYQTGNIIRLLITLKQGEDKQ